jgi:prefoldin subunit 5
MGLMDKVKAGAGDLASKAKEGAGDLAAKAKDEAKEYQLERELGKAYQELGEKTEELVTSGAVSHEDLSDLTAKIGDVKAKLAALDAGDGTAESGAPAS